MTKSHFRMYINGDAARPRQGHGLNSSIVRPQLREVVLLAKH